MLKTVKTLSIQMMLFLGVSQLSSQSNAQTISGALDDLERGKVAKALKDLKKLADKGDSYASFVLGDIYVQGDSVKQNDKGEDVLTLDTHEMIE